MEALLIIGSGERTEFLAIRRQSSLMTGWGPFLLRRSKKKGQSIEKDTLWYHSNGISPFLIGNTSSIRVHFPSCYVSLPEGSIFFWDVSSFFRDFRAQISTLKVQMFGQLGMPRFWLVGKIGFCPSKFMTSGKSSATFQRETPVIRGNIPFSN